MKSEVAKILRRVPDGSLPELEITFGDLSSLKGFLGYLLTIGKTKCGTIIHVEGKDISCETLTKSQILNVIDTGHHLNLVNFKAMPELGVNIYGGSLAIDFCTGACWTHEALDELETVLIKAKSEFGSEEIVLDEEEIRFSSDEREVFSRYFQDL